MKRTLIALSCLLLFAIPAYGQGGIRNDTALRADGKPAIGATVRVCTEAASGTPCSPTASIYSDKALTVSKTNPIAVDAAGAYTYYASPGFYKEQLCLGGTCVTRTVLMGSDAAIALMDTIELDRTNRDVVLSRESANRLKLASGDAFELDELSAGILNDIRVVDGNKFTTTQLAEDDLGANPGLVIVPSTYAGADPTSISGGITVLHLQKGDDSPVKQNVFWEAGQLDIVDQDGWVFQVNNHDYRDNANWSTGASPATSSLMALGWTTPATGGFSANDEAKVLALSMEHHHPTMPGVGLVIKVNPGVNNAGPIWGQNIGMSNNGFTGHGNIMALEINLGIDASGTFQPSPTGAAHVSGLVLTESSTGGVGKRSTAAINIFGTAAGQNWYHGININNNDTGANDMAYGLRMQNTIERPIDLLATTGQTQLGSILLPGLTEGGIAFQRNTGSAMRRALYVATGTDTLVLRTPGTGLQVQDEDENVIFTFQEDQNVVAGGRIAFKATVTLDDTGTPGIGGGNVFITGGTTAITAFDDGVNGQVIYILSAHSVTITDGAALSLAGAVPYAMTVDDTLTLMSHGGNWFEIARSVN